MPRKLIFYFPSDRQIYRKTTHMNYQWHYDKLIETRKLLNRLSCDDAYYERHHIIMKSMGGTNDESNLIYLTAREHFLAHWLLWRIHRNKQTALAFNCMLRVGKNQKRVYSSRGYKEAREAASIFFSIYAKMKFSGIPKTDEQRKKMSISASGKSKSVQHRKNISLANIGKTISDEIKTKISKSTSKDNNGRAKPIIQFNLDGIFIKRWWGISEIIKTFDYINQRELRNALRNNKEYNNFKWKYE